MSSPGVSWSVICPAVYFRNALRRHSKLSIFVLLKVMSSYNSNDFAFDCDLLPQFSDSGMSDRMKTGRCWSLQTSPRGDRCPQRRLPAYRIRWMPAMMRSWRKTTRGSVKQPFDSRCPASQSSALPRMTLLSSRWRSGHRVSPLLVPPLLVSPPLPLVRPLLLVRPPLLSPSPTWS